MGNHSSTRHPHYHTENDQALSDSNVSRSSSQTSLQDATEYQKFAAAQSVPIPTHGAIPGQGHHYTRMTREGEARIRTSPMEQDPLTTAPAGKNVRAPAMMVTTNTTRRPQQVFRRTASSDTATHATSTEDNSVLTQNTSSSAAYSISSVRSAPVTQHIRNHPFMTSKSSATSVSLGSSNGSSMGQRTPSALSLDGYERSLSNRSHYQQRNRSGYHRELPSLSEDFRDGNGSVHSNHHYQQRQRQRQQQQHKYRTNSKRNTFAKDGSLSDMLTRIDHHQGYYQQGPPPGAIPVIAVPNPHGGVVMMPSPQPYGHPVMHQPMPAAPLIRSRSAGGNASVYSAHTQQLRQPRGILRNGNFGENSSTYSKRRTTADQAYKQDMIKQYFAGK